MGRRRRRRHVAQSAGTAQRLSDGIYAGIANVLPQLESDRSVRVTMVTGEGSAFCAGGDVKAMNEGHRSERDRTSAGPDLRERTTWLRQRQSAVSLALHECSKPVVAALPGPVAGAGLSIALSADLRVAAPSTIVVPAFGTIGASGDFGGSWFRPNSSAHQRRRSCISGHLASMRRRLVTLGSSTRFSTATTSGSRA
ncbi:MAG: enoyl-CoA hydratase/isomerase family protein [Acidimicrobiales bacterium]